MVVRLLPGHLFAFVESETQFREQWDAARRDGLTLELTGCTDNRRRQENGVAVGPATVGPLYVSPESIQTFEVFEPDALGNSGLLELEQALWQGWEVSLPEHVQQARAAQAAKEQESAEARRGKAVVALLKDLATELARRDAPTTEFEFKGHQVPMWVLYYTEGYGTALDADGTLWSISYRSPEPKRQGTVARLWGAAPKRLPPVAIATSPDLRKAGDALFVGVTLRHVMKISQAQGISSSFLDRVRDIASDGNEHILGLVKWEVEGLLRRRPPA